MEKEKPMGELPGQPPLRKTDEHWREAWRIYDAVGQLSPEARVAWLQSVNPNPEVARIVSDLLARREEDEAAEDRPQLAPCGKRIGRFEVREPLGRGGMGEVYAARDTNLNRSVALKFLAASGLGSAGQIKRFIREAQAASALNHPGIVTARDPEFELAAALKTRPPAHGGRHNDRHFAFDK